MIKFAINKTRVAILTKIATLLGRGRRIRTLGTRFWRPLLYQLSYTPRYVIKFGGPSGTRTLDRPVMSRML